MISSLLGRLIQVILGFTCVAFLSTEGLAQTAPPRAQQHYARALELLKQHRLEEAKRELLEAAGLNPQQAEIRNLLGTVYDRLGQVDAAIQQYQSAIELSPRSAAGYNNLGIAYLRKQQQDLALEAFLRALRVDPANLSSLVNLGLLYLSRHQLDEAITHFEQARRKRPDDLGTLFNLSKAHYEKGNLQTCFEVLQQAGEPGSAVPEIQNLLGMVLARLDRPDKAIRHFEAAIRLRPETAESYYRLGLVYQKKEAWAQSKEYLEKAIKLEASPLPEQYLALSQACRRLGASERAIEALEKSLSIDPNSEPVRHALGTLFLETGRYREAAVQFQRITQLNPASPEPAVHLALAVHLLGDAKRALDKLNAFQLSPSFRATPLYYKVLARVLASEGRWPTALETLRRGSEQQPEETEFYFQMGLVLTNAGAIQDAVTLLTLSVERFPSSPSLRAALAQACMANDRYDLAEQRLQEAIRLSPDYDEPYYLLGHCHQEKNQYSKAIELYQKAIHLNPKRSEFHYSMGLALSRQGLLGQAQKAFQEALTLDPSLVEARYRMGLVHLERGADSLAETALLEAIKVDPNHAPSHYLLFRVYSRLGKPEKAAASLELFQDLRKKEARDKTVSAQEHEKLKPVDYYLAFLKRSER